MRYVMCVFCVFRVSFTNTCLFVYFFLYSRISCMRLTNTCFFHEYVPPRISCFFHEYVFLRVLLYSRISCIVSRIRVIFTFCSVLDQTMVRGEQNFHRSEVPRQARCLRWFREEPCRGGIRGKQEAVRQTEG